MGRCGGEEGGGIGRPIKVTLFTGMEEGEQFVIYHLTVIRHFALQMGLASKI